MAFRRRMAGWRLAALGYLIPVLAVPVCAWHHHNATADPAAQRTGQSPAAPPRSADRHAGDCALCAVATALIADLSPPLSIPELPHVPADAAPAATDRPVVRLAAHLARGPPSPLT
jgi:hypothetical protein